MLLGVQHLLIYIWMHLLLLIHCTISRTYHQLTSDKILRVRMKENWSVHTLRSRESVLPVVSKYCNSSSCGRSLRHGSQNNYFPSIFVTFTSLSFISPKRGGRGWTDICLLPVLVLHPVCLTSFFRVLSYAMVIQPLICFHVICLQIPTIKKASVIFS